MEYLHNIKIEKKLKSRKKLLGVKKRMNPTTFKGYPGLTHTAKEICEYIPKCILFVEPFAGLGRITKHVKSENYVLNDMSDFAIKYLTKNFKNHIITQTDYLDCIKKYDSINTFFFIDPPWFDEIYDINPLTCITESCNETYKKLESLLPNIKGNWIIAGKGNGVLKKWGYNHLEIKSKKNTLFGHKARVYLVSNLPFKKYYQKTIFMCE
jgi:hypothetical protein